MTKRKIPKMSITFCVLISLLIAACSGDKKIYRDVRPLMGTIVEISICHSEERQAQFVLQKAFEEMARIENMMSQYREGSEVSRINAQAFDHPVKVSDELFGLLQTSVRYNAVSQGAFDITVGPLMKLWPFYKQEVTLPSRQEILDALRSVGSDKIELDARGKTVRFTQPDMALDLGGIAKGYAVDRAIQIIKAAGVKCALVNAGGDLYALGKKPGGQKWRMGVQHPRKLNRLVCAFDIEDTAVATSGDYERFFMKDGRRYCHIIDPKTGMPANESVSVTVQADNATRADALATAVFVLGPEKGLAMVEKMPGVEGAIIFKGADGKLDVSVSSGLKERFVVDKKDLEN